MFFANFARMNFTVKQIVNKLYETMKLVSDLSVYVFSEIEEVRAGSLMFLLNSKYIEYLYAINTFVANAKHVFKLEINIKS